MLEVEVQGESTQKTSFYPWRLIGASGTQEAVSMVRAGRLST